LPQVELELEPELPQLAVELELEQLGAELELELEQLGGLELELLGLAQLEPLEELEELLLLLLWHAVPVEETDGLFSLGDDVCCGGGAVPAGVLSGPGARARLGGWRRRDGRDTP
jgi:hypothetical protein